MSGRAGGRRTGGLVGKPCHPSGSTTGPTVGLWAQLHHAIIPLKVPIATTAASALCLQDDADAMADLQDKAGASTQQVARFLKTLLDRSHH